MPVDSHSLQGCPRRRLEWEEDEQGRALVLRPKFGEGRWGSWIASHVKNPYYRIRLDEVGTLVWKSCDGATEVSEIAERMRRQFGARIEPAEERLYRFLRQMYRSRLIE